MWTRSLPASFGIVLLVACGGVVERSSRDLEDSEPGAPAELPADDEPEDGPSGGINPNADTELGECVRGFPEASARPCAWVADGRCYDTRQMACNCACPRDRNSQCLSGFERGPDGHVSVDCD
ncbi:MAG: hypothetical protein K0R38_7072 [Polyangiaceae bacterium]|jgi:hypothetical protein|nr:hypothetical protein [Polyangiaceae bacterium]